MNQQQRIPELDGIRGLAILLVLVWHYVALGVPIDPGSQLFRVVFYLRNSWAGVDLFFVLSGFLIGGILIDARNSPTYFRTFFVRRIARILPLYFAFLLLFEVLRWAHESGHSGLFGYLTQNALPAWAYWTMVQNFYSSIVGDWGSHWHGVTWSLAIEEQFYLTLPFIIRFAPTRILPWIIALFVVIAPLLRTLLFFLLDENRQLATYWLTPCRTDALGLGVLGALLVRSPHYKALIVEKHRWTLWLGFALGLWGFVYLSINGQGAGTLHTATWGHSAIAVLFFSFLILSVTEPKGAFGWFTRLWPLRRLGIIAYGVYLLHYPVLVILHQWWFGGPPNIMGEARAWMTLAAFVVTVIISEASWRWFERPIVRLGQRLQY